MITVVVKCLGVYNTMAAVVKCLMNRELLKSQRCANLLCTMTLKLPFEKFDQKHTKKRLPHFSKVRVLQRPVNVTNSRNYDISDNIRSRRRSDSKIFGSPDLSVFLKHHLSDDSVYSGETMFQILGIP